MSTSNWLKVPVGPHARRWNTIRPERTVLVVAHTVTALNRLEDILTVFDSDRRVQLVYTIPEASSVASTRVDGELRRAGAVVMPWQQATMTEFDLAISVHHSGNLHEINAPLAVLSHGLGYTKYGNRKPETGNRTAYGLSAEWLTRNGVVVPSAIVLSHAEELPRLAAAVPQAVSAAIVAGDPCFDRIVSSLAHRRAYRTMLGADDSTTVVFVSSTWGSESSFGRFPDLIAHLLAELSMDDHIVCAALHPNTWDAHGPAQVRLWLADCLRAGLRLIPAVRGWQQALIAADVVLGDHGAVTGYGAALGRPTLLAAYPSADVVPESAIGALGRSAKKLDLRQPLHPQLRATIAAPGDHARTRALATSAPGESPTLLRRAFYELMGLPEPGTPALLASYAPADLAPEQLPVTAWWARAEIIDNRDFRLDRWPADVTASVAGLSDAAERHLVVAMSHPRRDLGTVASIVVAEDGGPGPDDIFAQRPACRLVAVPRGQSMCGIVSRRGDAGTLTIETDGTSVEATTCASAVHAWLASGRQWADLPGRLHLRLGHQRVEIRLDR